MNVYSIKKEKNGKTYTDFVLVWENEGKVCDMRIRPGLDNKNLYKVLYAMSEKLGNYEEFSKVVGKTRVA